MQEGWCGRYKTLGTVQIVYSTQLLDSKAPLRRHFLVYVFLGFSWYFSSVVGFFFSSIFSSFLRRVWKSSGKLEIYHCILFTVVHSILPYLTCKFLIKDVAGFSFFVRRSSQLIQSFVVQKFTQNGAVFTWRMGGEWRRQKTFTFEYILILYPFFFRGKSFCFLVYFLPFYNGETWGRDEWVVSNPFLWSVHSKKSIDILKLYIWDKYETDFNFANFTIRRTINWVSLNFCNKMSNLPFLHNDMKHSSQMSSTVKPR